jgi:predicted nucleic acid-binding protein
MSEVFADAVYYIGLLNPSDQFHAAAVDATLNLRRRIITTIWVLIEVADALSSPLVRQRTHVFLTRIASDPNTTVILDSARRYDRGLALFGSRGDKEWSLTDCISFEVMKEHGIAEALTGDHHFVQAGYRALLLPPGDV